MKDSSRICYAESDFLMLSGIQHFIFCRRQWALIHIENQWQENILTLMGDQFHEVAHETGRSFEKRGPLLITRGLPVHSCSLGLSGTCDVVEFHEDNKGISLYGFSKYYSPIVVEYKSGQPKNDDSDILQVAAQTVCLEEMLSCTIPSAMLYYGKNKRRLAVNMTDEIREKLRSTCFEMHQLFESGKTPLVKQTNKCAACSLKEVCVPSLQKLYSVEQYIQERLTET